MVRCPGHVGPTGLLENGYPLGGYQVFAGTSEWDRMEATPVRWISARRAGIASPQAYVFHRSSRRAGLGLRSLVLEEMGSKTDGWSFPSCYLPGDRRVFQFTLRLRLLGDMCQQTWKPSTRNTQVPRHGTQIGGR